MQHRLVATLQAKAACMAMAQCISKNQGVHSPGKPRKVREFQSGQRKVRKNEISVMTTGDQEMLYGNSRMQENLLVAGAPSRTPLGELRVLPWMP